MNRGCQYISMFVILCQLFGILRKFHNLALDPMRRGQKIFYFLLNDRLFAFMVMFFHIATCFDPYRLNGWEIAFEADSNFVLLKVWVGLTPALWLTFGLFSRTPFFFQIVIFVFSFVFVMWCQYFFVVYKDKQKETEKRVRRMLSGWTSPVSDKEVDSLKNKGIQFMNEMLGFGVFGTTYRCAYTTRDGDFVLKVIDIIEWERNLKPDKPEGQVRDEWLNPEQIRKSFNDNMHRLRALEHRHVVRFESIENWMRENSRLYLITRLAQMNLDTFLTKYRPYGVPEEWAREWFSQLCNGVNYLHHIFEGIPFTHSNIKPENVLLYRLNGRQRNGLQNQQMFGRREDEINPNQRERVVDNGFEMKDQFILKLSDCGLDRFLPLYGRVVTKKDPPIVISPPKKCIGKKNLRIMAYVERPEEKRFDDIFQLGVILLLLLKGDIRRLMPSPKDSYRIHQYVTGVDAFFIRMDRPAVIRKLLPDGRPELHLLLRKMLEWEPLMRYDIKQVMDSEWMAKVAQRVVQN